jgi:ATP-dependent Clp protease ATP-binding subunit ClpC
VVAMGHRPWAYLCAVATNRLTPDSDEAVRAYIEAEDVAAHTAQAPSSAHLLLALFNFSNRAQVLLRERRIDADWVRRRLTDAQSEPRRSFARLKERARDIARQSEAKEVDCLHVLVAITRQRDSVAYAILKASENTFGTSVSALRNVAVSYITGNLPRRFSALPKAHSQADGMRLVLQGRQPKRTGVSESLPTKPPAAAAPRPHGGDVAPQRKAAETTSKVDVQPSDHGVAALAPLAVFALPQGVEALGEQSPAPASIATQEVGIQTQQTAEALGESRAELPRAQTDTKRAVIQLGYSLAELLRTGVDPERTKTPAELLETGTKYPGWLNPDAGLKSSTAQASSNSHELLRPGADPKSPVTPTGLNYPEWLKPGGDSENSAEQAGSNFPELVKPASDTKGSAAPGGSTSPESLQPEINPESSTPPLGDSPIDVLVAGARAARTAALLGASPSELQEADAEAKQQPVSCDLRALAPTLCACGIDLTERARRGELDAAVGRETEIQTLIDILGKRRGNNPILVGAPGVGKTAIVEGLAVKIVRRDPEVSSYFDCHLVALDTGSLEAGTSLRGAFSERLGAIKAEVAAAKRRIIVFIDEIHCLLGAGQSGEGSSDAAGELKTALARGEFPCIGATTDDEFTRYIEKDAALERRFTAIAVQEPSCAEALLILEGAIGPYAQHHAVTYSLAALQAAVHLSHQFVTERKLPDKAFAAIDLAGSRAHRNGASTVERSDVAQVVSVWSGVPLQRLVAADMQRLSAAESALSSQLVGHTEVVEQVARTLRRGFAGLNGARPMGSFLFLGPTGVGKTELAKVLAEFVFGRRDALVRFDMSELSERHSVARLVGAQPGYVGFEEGGQLTEALRKRPFQIVLFDEIEKAHPNVLNLLLQVLDDGLLTDSRGRHIAFNHALIIMTSNLGSDAVGPRGIGFGSPDGAAPAQSTQASEGAAQRLRRSILTAAQAGLTKELWSRVDEHLVFLPLQPAQLQQVATLQLRDCAARLLQQQQVHLLWDAAVPQHLSEAATAATAFGARSLRQSLSHQVESPIAEMLLAGKLRAHHTVRLSVTAQQRLKVSRQARPPAARPQATA